jgi:hypothetical protein
MARHACYASSGLPSRKPFELVPPETWFARARARVYVCGKQLYLPAQCFAAQLLCLLSILELSMSILQIWRSLLIVYFYICNCCTRECCWHREQCIAM